MTFIDLIGIFGYMGLTGAFFLCAIQVLLAIYLHIRHSDELEKLAQLLTHTQTAFLGAAFLSLAVLLQMGAYEYELVFNAVENNMSWVERIGGLWSGQASSLLFWSLVMSAAASLSLQISKRLRHNGYSRTVLMVLEVTLLFFILPDVFFSNPFVKVWITQTGEIMTKVFPPGNASLLVAVDGQGMNPQLRHTAMLFHPPALYLGLVGFFIPYAFAIASLVNGDKTKEWMEAVLPYTLAAWIFLTIGMLLGSWWAYTILGWGGYWGWDAVEIAGLLPWLLSFGLLHTMRMQPHSGNFKRWMYALSFGVVLLILLGILITRSGILESVHAYSSGVMGPALTVLLALHIFLITTLMIKHKADSAQRTASGPSKFSNQLVNWFNYCLVGLVLIYLFGQTLPLTSGIFFTEKLSFSPQDYEYASTPHLFFLLIITALYPLAENYERNPGRFRRELAVLILSSAAFPVSTLFFAPFSFALVFGFWAAGFLFVSWLYAVFKSFLKPVLFKEKRKPIGRMNNRIGMLCIHFGFAIMAVGIMGVESLTNTYNIQLNPGESISINKQIFTAAAAETKNAESGYETVRTVITGEARTGKKRDYAPSITFFSKTNSLYSEPAVAPGFLQDTQIILKEIPDTQNGPLELRITFFPLMSWIWAGSALMPLGGLMTITGIRKK